MQVCKKYIFWLIVSLKKLLGCAIITVEHTERGREDMGIINRLFEGGTTEIVICGGGHVAYELEKLCAFMGWKTTVIESRTELSGAERFPHSEILRGDYAGMLSGITKPGLYYVIVTPEHSHDTECLRVALRKDYAYIGMIGSKRKVKACMDTLRGEGFGDELLKSVHAPIGIDIASETPKEIAVSITAEIIKTAAADRPVFRLESGDREKLMKMRGRAVCAVITEKRGSAPRGKGAYVFVSASGVIGTVGGGKWEADVLRDARSILEGRELPGLRTYSSVTEDALCGGEIDVLFEVDEL